MAAAKARIVDADVRPWINGDVKGLMPYLSTAWRRRLGLKVVTAEFGYSWVPHLLWRMDQNWREFRREVPWIVPEPSKLVLEHARFTSQPAEEPEKPEYLLQPWR